MIEHILFLIFFIFPLTCRCQCPNNWIGQNCSQVNLCNLCPDGFYCQNQACLATGTFEGNTSQLIGTFHSDLILTNEISFRLRAHTQVEHLFTVKNLNNSDGFSLSLSNENFTLS